MNKEQPTKTKEVSKYITIIRPEFMTFCKDACRAAALNHLLFRIAYKCKDQPKEKIQAGKILWYAKTELITNEMSDAWGVCKVRKEVNGLISMGLLGKKSNPTWGADRTKHFFFGSEQCKVLVDLCEKNDICIVHLGLPAEVVHLIYSSNANDKSIKCSCSEDEKAGANDKSIECKSYNHQMETIDLSNANDKSIEAITKITTKRSTEDNNEEESTNPREQHTDNSATAIADRDAHTLSSSQDLLAEAHASNALSQQDERVYTNSLLPDGSVYSAGAPPKQGDAHDLRHHSVGATAHDAGPLSGNDGARHEPARRDTPRVEQNTGTARTATQAVAAQFSTSTASFPQDSAKSSGRKSKAAVPGKTAKASTSEPEPAFTEEGSKLFGSWCSLFKSPPPAGPQTIKCANALYPLLMPWCKDLHRTCSQLLGDIQKWMYATDKSDWYKRGITLCDVYRDFEKWQSAKTRELNQGPQQNHMLYSDEELRESSAIAEAEMWAELASPEVQAKLNALRAKGVQV